MSALYHKYYDLNFFGDYYRLANPFEQVNLVAWETVAKDKSEALVTVITVNLTVNGPEQFRSAGRLRLSERVRRPCRDGNGPHARRSSDPSRDSGIHGLPLSSDSNLTTIVFPQKKWAKAYCFGPLFYLHKCSLCKYFSSAVQPCSTSSQVSSKLSVYQGSATSCPFLPQ